MERPDRAERPREDNHNSPYNRVRDDRSDRHHDRSGTSSPSHDRDRDRDRDYRVRERSPRRSVSAERRRRSRSRTPPRDDKGRDRRSSRSRTPPRRRRTPSPTSGEGQRYRRDYNSPYNDSSRGGYGYDPSRGRGGWMRGGPHYPGRGAYSYRPSGPPYHHRGPDPNSSYVPRGPPPMQNPEFSQTPTASSSNTETNPSSEIPSAPAGPASWRRAQQYRQERPFQQDYRPTYPPSGPGRGAPFPRTSPRPPFPPNPQSPAVSAPESSTTSPPLNRIPTGPRAFNRPVEPPSKKEYVSPVPDLDEKVRGFKAVGLIVDGKIKSGT